MREEKHARGTGQSAGSAVMNHRYAVRLLCAYGDSLWIECTSPPHLRGENWLQVIAMPQPRVRRADRVTGRGDHEGAPARGSGGPPARVRERAHCINGASGSRAAPANRSRYCWAGPVRADRCRLERVEKLGVDSVPVYSARLVRSG